MWLGLMKVVFNFTDPHASFHSEKTKCLGKSCPISVMVFLPEGTLFYKTLFVYVQFAYICMLFAELELTGQPSNSKKDIYILP